MPEPPAPTGAAAPPAATDRLFFAVFPDPRSADAIHDLAHRLADECGLRAEPLAPQRLHVTVSFLGDHVGLPAALVERAVAAAGSVNLPAFDVVLDRVLSLGRGGRRVPLVLGGEVVHGLVRLHAALNGALARVGVTESDRRAYHPHLTLLYAEHPITERAVAAIHFRALEFVLLRSPLGGCRYQVLGRWPLAL